MRNIIIYLIIASVLLLVTSAVFTSASIEPKYVDITNKNQILLKNAQFYTNTTSPVNTSSALTIAQYPADFEGYYIIQFTGCVTEEWKQTVRNAGAVLFDYVPENAFVVRMNSSVKARVEALDCVTWVGIYQPEYRIESGLLVTAASVDTDKAVIKKIKVLLFDARDNTRVSNEIIRYGGDIEDNAGKLISISIEESMIANIASIHGVCWVEKYGPFVLFNDVAASIINVSTVHSTYGLNGSGQIVAVADSGLDTGVNDDTMHNDLKGRIVALIDRSNNSAVDNHSGHGTHVAGSVLGNGSCSGGKIKGMAPEAKLVFQAVEDANRDLTGIPLNIAELFQQAYDQGARIHTNSWGNDVNGSYTIDSFNLDIFAWEHPDMLILFAAGNSGVDVNASDGVIDPDSICSPATAKNCLTIGASENLRQSKANTYGGSWDSDFPAEPIYSDKMSNNSEGLAAFSSRGPTDDGRIKPEVVAPGTFILSTRSSVASETGWGVKNETYLYMGGTSMSTPITAGAAALVRQYYTQNESITPSAALLKATIINGAYNMTPGQYGNGTTREIQTRPDNASGWGRVDIDNTLFPAYPRIMRYHDNITLNTSQSWNVNYYLENSSKPLRVTLVWTDYPPLVSANISLVNNLDLTVTGPNGTYYGNGAVDEHNNVEGIELLSPAVGRYNISVKGTNIPQGPQPFALVISGLLDRAPLAEGEFPSDISYTNNNTTVVSVNITDSRDALNVSSINMSINGTLVIFTNTSITNGYKIKNLTATPYDDGIINCSVNASDNTSNLMTYSWSFTVDTIPPISNNPVNTTFYADTTANFTNWTLTDLHPGYYRVLLNDSQTVSPIQWSNDTNLIVPVNTTRGTGCFNYTIQYNDSAGNNGTQDTVFITIYDNSAPTLSDHAPANGTGNLTPVISINASDGGSFVNVSSANMTVDRIQVILSNSSSQITYTFCNTTIIPYNHSDTINVTFNISDHAGYSSNRSWMFYIDNVTPMISISSPTNGSSTTAGSITVSGTVNGTGSPPTVTVNNITTATTLTDFSGSFKSAVSLSMGVNTIYANVSDMAGNNNTTSVNITRVSPPAPSTSSGGGSGGGGSSGEAFENIELKETKRVYVSKYNHVNFSFEKKENVVEYIKYRSLKNAGTVAVIVEVLKNTSTLVNQSPSGVVYQNINIWVGPSGYATRRNMEYPVIGFKVEKKWIDDNDIDPGSIILNRYNNDVWDLLPTEKIEDNRSYLYFESQTTGFSPFAITAQKNIQNTSASAESETTGGTSSATEKSTSYSTLPQRFFSIMGFLLGGVIVLVGLAGLVILVLIIKYLKK